MKVTFLEVNTVLARMHTFMLCALGEVGPRNVILRLQSLADQSFVALVDRTLHERILETLHLFFLVLHVGNVAESGIDLLLLSQHLG